jgi:acyl carrier protein
LAGAGNSAAIGDNSMTVESIQQYLCSEIETLLSLKAGSIKLDTELAAVGIPSLSFVSLLLAVEQKFGVNLLEKGLQIEDTKTPRALAAAVLAGQAS